MAEHADLPPPPKMFFTQMRRATRLGYWLHKADREWQRQKQGGRYVLTLPRGRDPLLVTDDMREVKAWLNHRDAETREGEQHG
ncbi:hypothetical protein GCM10007160_16840 [Litchfieldella qijiaojingensis]|uniref:Uncharacterized protein n=1 Tax=Litchfieldella qijiaojingensis TaxID=980347 RepID=A0ABQ2YPY3_9GAMM|nr:hypothetical protein [Halomonas qijiaojingensis]GGX90026.1 hypothetical protein GCM10007160_16840 [Halomonas qijiaojingensis]